MLIGEYGEILKSKKNDITTIEDENIEKFFDRLVIDWRHLEKSRIRYGYNIESQRIYLKEKYQFHLLEQLINLLKSKEKSIFHHAAFLTIVLYKCESDRFHKTVKGLCNNNWREKL